MAKVLDSYWFTTFGGLIGLVLVENEVGTKKCYIGIGRGLSQEEDEKEIANRGAKFSKKGTVCFINRATE